MPALGAGGVGLGGIRQGPLCAGGLLRRRGGRLQREHHLRRLGRLRGRLMRHFLLLPLSVRGLTGGVGMPAVQRALVTPSCLAHRLPSRSRPAQLTAVALTSVTPAAQEELPQALGPATHHETQCFHAPPGAWLASGVAARSALPPSHRPPTSHSLGAPPGRPSRCSWRAFRFSGARARAPSAPHILPTTFQSPLHPSNYPRVTCGRAHLAGTADPGRPRRWRSGIPVEG
jgi:hypothetical protein